MSSSTWKTDPTSSEWNTKANWKPAAVPTDTATFAASRQTPITFSSREAATVKKIEFSDDASSYNFQFDSSVPTPALTIKGEGIANHSNRPQHFTVASKGASYKKPQLKFTNAATAGGDDMHYYAGPESLEYGYGGGIIGFCDKATAGSASFTIKTGAKAPPKNGSTVGGEVSFSDSSSAGTARFTVFGTLGSDGDTFGNAVFHDRATADNGTFTNIGGTVPGGDGGNTQFYDSSTAAHGVFHNRGGTSYGSTGGSDGELQGANGGDVAFDGASNGGYGSFHNHAATVTGANGGVTSFNNNPPEATPGASAGHGWYHNYGALEADQGGGGHTEFTAQHGSPTAANGTFHNYGSALKDSSSAGHTSLSKNAGSEYHPTAGHGTFWNHPALTSKGAAGYTEFAVWSDDSDTDSADAASARKVPTAGDGTFYNLGGKTHGAAGGYMSFKNTTTAGNAQLVAYGGTNGGEGGQINFYDRSSGGAARVQLFGNAVLDISYHTEGLTIGSLELTGGGTIKTQLGADLTRLNVSGDLTLNATVATFSFWQEDGRHGFELNKVYTILTAANLSEFTADQFSGNSLEGVQPTFTIVGNHLHVCFKQN